MATIRFETWGEAVAEVMLPTQNDRDAQSIRLFLAGLPLPISLEYLGSAQERRMLLRGARPKLQEAAALLESSFPRSRVHLLEEDPAQFLLCSLERESYAVCLQVPAYLPIRTWESFAEGDPAWTILSKLAGLQAGEGLWLQIGLLARTQPDWLKPTQRRVKLEAQRGFLSVAGAGASGEAVRRSLPEETHFLNGFLWVGVILLALGIVGAALSGQMVLAAALFLFTITLALGWRRLTEREDAWQQADLKQVAHKSIEQGGILAVSIRASLKGNGPERRAELRERLEAILAQYARSGGNAFRLVELAPKIAVTSPAEARLELSLEELSGLWHLPLVVARGAPGAIGVNTVEVRSPHPRDVRGFFRIGDYPRPDGGWETAQIGDWALRRNIALFGKPGQGKSILSIHLALAAIQSAEQSCVVVIDPHGDLANHLLGCLRAEDLPRVRLLDLLDPDYLLTFNPLEMHHQGLSHEAAGQVIVDMGKLLWKDFWGPRMQIPLSRAVQALAAANLFHAADDQYGLSLLSEFINISHEARRAFLDEELEAREEFREIRSYFEGEFRALTYPMREQIVQPVLSKASRFRENPLLPLLSCPISKLDLGEVISRRQILIINTRFSGLGEELSNFSGSLLLNLLMRAVARQGERRAEERVPVRVLVDEFQTYSGVGWMEWEQQLRKWGGSMILGTQSLSSLRATQGVELPGILTSGTASLFVFAVNGEDAEYLSKNELNGNAGGPAPETLTNLPPYTCYARLAREDGSPSQPFTLRTAAPPTFDARVADQVRALRKDYSLPLATALSAARGKLNALEKYQNGLLSTGSGQGQTGRIAGGVESSPPQPKRPKGEKGSMEGDVSFDDQELANRVESDLEKFYGEELGSKDAPPREDQDADEEDV